MQSQTPPSSNDPKETFQTPSSRWLALTHRTPSSHSSFLYGVRSTKIYCRPTCSARLARRANVVYYDTAEEAQRDGYRPCKRCKPDDASFVGESEEVVTRAIALLRTKKDVTVMKRSLKDLARDVGVTPSYLCAVFKKVMGVTLGTYVREFEKEDKMQNVINSTLSKDGPKPMNVETGLLTPAISPGNLSAPVEERIGSPCVEENPAYTEGVLESDFDFDQWFWTKDFSNDSIDRPNVSW